MCVRTESTTNLADRIRIFPEFLSFLETQKFDLPTAGPV